MIVYLARDIQAFVMYCVNGESGSSLLIESTDSMICTFKRIMHLPMLYSIQHCMAVYRFTYSLSGKFCINGSAVSNWYITSNSAEDSENIQYNTMSTYTMHLHMGAMHFTYIYRYIDNVRD